MDDRINDIHLRLIKFFKDHENEEITFEQLSKEFSYQEILDLVKASHQAPILTKYVYPMDKPKEFYDYLESELKDPDVPDSVKNSLLFIASEDYLLECIKNDKFNLLHFWAFRTDEYRLKALNLKKIKSNDYIYIKGIQSLDDDRLKIKFLRKIFVTDKGEILSSIKDAKLKEELIPKYLKYADHLICHLADENMRIYYYEKYFSKLNDEARCKIFFTFSEENKQKYLERYWKKLSSSSKISQLASIENKDIILEKTKDITDDMDLIILIVNLHRNNHTELASEIAKRITYKNRKLYKKKVLTRIPNDAWRYLDWEKLLQGWSEKEKLYIIDAAWSLDVKICILATLKDFKTIEKKLEHENQLREYDPKYNLLIHKYAKHYNLNEEHLLELLKVTGMELLKDLKNNNIQQIINFNNEDFNKVIRLLNPENYELDNNTINDNVNILLQRMFRQLFPDIININQAIKFAIQKGDKVQALGLINGIIDEIDISKILKEYNITSEEFLEAVFKNDNPESLGLKCLHDITNAYIVYKRNQFIQENIEVYRAKFSRTLYEDKSALKYIIETFPVDLIMDTYFEKPTNYSSIQKFNEQELKLLKNSELIRKIIDFRRNPSKYETMPEDIKIHMPIFNKIFEKNFDGDLSFKPPRGIVKPYYEPEKMYENKANLDVLFALEPELLKKGILASEEQYNLLVGTLEGYKIIGWNEAMKEEFAKYDLIGDSYTLSFLIQYFPIIYKDLQNKVDNGELKTITLTSLLDLAQCYSMDTTKRTLLFGADNIRLLASNPGPNKASMKKEERLKRGEELMPKLLERKTVAVPTCDRDFELPNGKKININVGNFSNPINLTYGERTGACMRIGGAGASLFDYCLENEHGFHIRFSSPKDERFVSRVSGFRNGNTVFLNELRLSTDPRYSDQDIRDACTLIAQTLIEETKDSPNPIQNVVITPAYAMEGYPTVTLGVSNLQEGIGSFYTDIGNKNAVILATSNPDNLLVPINLNNSGIPRYPVQRDRVRFYDGKLAEVQMKKIEILDQMVSGKKLEDIEVTEKKDIAFCYSGEDWYVCVDKQGNITEYVMENSNKKEQANREKKECLKQIKLQLGIQIGDEQNTNSNGVGGAKK